MGKMRTKADLPQKPCATCGRPFSWRKKWGRDWDSVRYCSDRCRSGRGRSAESATQGQASPGETPRNR